MTGSNFDDTTAPEGEERAETGDELYMMEGRSYVLCSVEFPSTRWIEIDSVIDLDEWR